MSESESVSSVPESKKRKESETSRSVVWDHFDKILDDKGALVRGQCKYCAKSYAAQVKKHGTTSLKNHMKSCLKNPHAKETRQSILAFQASKSEDSQSVLTSWVFNQEATRKGLAKMIIIDELPFVFVEGRGFRQFMDLACPMFKIPSRWTVNRDIYGIYLEEREILKKMFKEKAQRVCLTTDTWTSVQMINYMCITAHFIDTEWKLHKKVISFVQINSHKGESIAKAIEDCLVDWGIKRISTITVDNASSNDVAITFLRSKLVSWGCSSVRAQYLHMRCIAHILNLVVQDGMKLADSSIKRLRNWIRWIRGSPNRIQKFRQMADLLGVEDKSSLCLDVPTRWNSTYMMIRTAVVFKEVFQSYDEESFKNDLGDNAMVTSADWLYIEMMLILLKNFYEMTVRISGSLYVTSNSFLPEISDLSCIIEDLRTATTKTEQDMGTKMKDKFDKYWGDPTKMNFIIFFANILDPRDKMAYMQTQLNQMFGTYVGEDCFTKIKSKLTALFDDYVIEYSTSSSSSISRSSSGASGANVFNCPPPTPPVERVNPIPIARGPSRLKSQMLKEKTESGDDQNKKSELEIYLSEDLQVEKSDENSHFDILAWWKINSARFPVLSKLARDILAVPISTVASESAFSTSGRVLDCFRSSLTPKIVQALLCTQDWLRGPNQPLEVEENLEDIEKFEEELANLRVGSVSDDDVSGACGGMRMNVD